MSTDDLLAQARQQEQTPFDFIIVGSGAGGGPLAARLARAGRRVLLLEAGQDPKQAKSADYPAAEPGEIHQCPGYHGAATEDKEMSWQFSVRHYQDDARQARDEKYNKLILDPGSASETPPYLPHRRFLDPAPTGRGKGGIFYPRTAALGGCTAHHAMIVAAPNDKDWDYIADLTGDNSWRAKHMRGYFARLERCLYLDAYRQWFRRLLGLLYGAWQWLVLQFDPKAVLDNGGHGRDGWQPTSFIDPQLVENIARHDRGFLEVLARTTLSVLHGRLSLVGMLKKALFRMRIVQHIDPNDLNTRRTSPEGVFLIPTGVETGGDVDENGQPQFGRRTGVREFLLKTRNAHPDRLVIVQGVQVTRVLFDQGRGPAPAAVGVEVATGDHLYEASPLQPRTLPQERVRYFSRGEVILCGGAFNTPQLLMLSGIGDEAHLREVSERSAEGALPGLSGPDGKPLVDPHSGRPRGFIHLPGVGRNLQDRYEVSVISELDRDFTTLQGVSFVPGDPHDPARLQWLRDKSGLYRTNGGSLAVLRRSSALGADEPEPDLFTFGAPAAFRGYYFGWSRELFRARMGVAKEQHNLWSWIILKAYTRNQAGSVRLRTASPFDQPEICFDSFNERAEREAGELAELAAPYRRAGLPLPAELERRICENEAALADGRRDLDAVVDAIRFMRRINARNPRQFTREIQPGQELADDSEELREWIRTQAWGHHCSCTCRIGADVWRADTRQLHDREAVLDSRFRVHGVRGLRVVDASVFPRIPGYFILTPILMMSEKAADTILQDFQQEVYPAAFAAEEASLIRQRRLQAFAGAHPGVETKPAGQLPADTVGLAISGGGIRSATFALGVLQALAARDWLRRIDLLSTVSGGGFIGTFLGRLFTRRSVITPPPGGLAAADPCGRVQEVLKNSDSGPLWWLRTHADYIFAAGADDVRQTLAVFWRNLCTVYLVVGALLFGCFGLAAWLPGVIDLPQPPEVQGIRLSVWWLLPLAVLGLGVLPATLGYWLAPKLNSYRPYPIFAFLAWVVLICGGVAGFLLPHALGWAAGALLTLLLAWLWQEVARWGIHQEQVQGSGLKQTGALVRNRLTRGLGEALSLFAALAGWVVLDTLARLVAEGSVTIALTGVMAVLSPFLPALRWVGTRAAREASTGPRQGFSLTRVANLLGIPLALFLLFVLDVLAHELFLRFPGWSWGAAALGLAFLFSLALGRAFDFLNQSSLHATYAVRLTRTFQGASNEERVYSNGSGAATDIQLAHPQDDLPFHQYHPEAHGGPLHLINVCINETVDLASGREVRDRKGLPMCLGPTGVSVGRRYFARWSAPDGLPRWQKRRRRLEGVDEEDAWRVEDRPRTALEALPVGSDPNAFHVLASKSSPSAEVQSLSLGAWTAISGAAYSTGIGRGTRLAVSLFMGLANIRLGFWWDSGILEHERPDRYPQPLWRRLKRLPVSLFRMQSLLLSEWRGRFHGASRWFWYLSDGGHFDVTGLYELVRRRTPLMILLDGGEDPEYQWSDLAQLTRQVREDFGAQIHWIDPGRGGAERGPDWRAVNQAAEAMDDPNIRDPARKAVPAWVQERISAEALGPLKTMARNGTHQAALGRVSYDRSPDEVSWLLVLKPGVSPEMTEDVQNYAALHPAFPQQPTIDQVFNDSQWESYRALGQQLGLRVLR